MTPDVYKIWNKIEKEQISDSGDWVTYVITNEGDRSDLIVYNTRSKKEFKYPHATQGKFSKDETHFIFKIKPHPDTMHLAKKKKLKKSKMPKDTLGILDLTLMELEKIKDVTSFKLPKENPDVIAIKLAPRSIKKDSTLVKEEGKDNGSRLLVKHLGSGPSKAIGYVLDYEWSDQNGKLAVHTTSNDSTKADKVLLYDSKSDRILNVLDQIGDYSRFSFSENGAHLAFIANRDTTAKNDNSYEIFLWKDGMRKARVVADKSKNFIPQNARISKHKKPQFLKYKDMVLFGVEEIPLEPDTTTLEEEKVSLEIWHYKDDLLQTQQTIQKDKKLKESYTAVHDLQTGQTRMLNSKLDPNLFINSEHQGTYVLSYDNEQYLKYRSWLGYDYKDLYLTDLKSGKKQLLKKAIVGRPRLSPSGQYVSWYSRVDTTWNTIDVNTQKHVVLSSGKFYDELNDRPLKPSASGQMIWTNRDELIVYDHYDLWKLNPRTGGQEQLTKGRSSDLRYRYVNLDREVRSLPEDTTVLLRYFNRVDKTEGYASISMGNYKVEKLIGGPKGYNKIKKAKHTDDIIFTSEDFEEFPDLIHSDLSFKKTDKFSKANPQQADYDWGSMELYRWSDKNGITRQALLAKPPHFNPAKKYPLMVNFYEKSSDRLYNHRAPYAHRSTINYSYYTNRGYVIFNPDIYYEDGYPGESCYDAVMTSVDSLVKEGFIDENRMGLQGHSWGGYQIAYLLTKTDRFKCAESGAPVVNMVSAYGGIRWGTGMSRMFQYEKTQSRLGATLWERPDLYLYNSPIFNMDKVETPVLILHNDKDGAVPWYQGIEYFVALRRLGKPAWMLNYNDEPHWPVKRQNRIDFNIRMEQFFDHYLKGSAIPVWMEEGVPAVEKGLNTGLQFPSNNPD